MEGPPRVQAVYTKQAISLWYKDVHSSAYANRILVTYGTHMFTLSYQPTPGELEWEKELGKTGEPIVKLMKDLFNKGYHLYIDNWYTSEAVCRYLEERETGVCGTAPKERLKVPQSMINERLEKGDHVYRRDGNLLMIRYLDKKEIYLLSTFHQANLSSLYFPPSKSSQNSTNLKRW